MRTLVTFPTELGHEFGFAIENDLSARSEFAVMPSWSSCDPDETERWMPFMERVVIYLDSDGDWIDDVAPTIRMANAMCIPIEYRTLDPVPRPSFWRRVSEGLRDMVS